MKLHFYNYGKDITEQEVEQRAKEYANTRKYTLDELANSILTVEEIIRLAFIAGAHSRDLEVLLLNARVVTQEGIINNFRNPWISVEERLPRKLKKKNYSKEVLCKTDGGTLLVSIYNYKKREWVDGIYIKITHWMPIPDFLDKKGE